MDYSDRAGNCCSILLGERVALCLVLFARCTILLSNWPWDLPTPPERTLTPYPTRGPDSLAPVFMHGLPVTRSPLHRNIPFILRVYVG
jgi:hypothetical protein